MKRIGVLGGIGPQATMDFEARVHRVAQRLVPQDWGRGYPPMVVWYHRRPPVSLGDDGRAVLPMEIDPQLVDAAAWLGKAADFLVIPCNSAHVGLPAIVQAAGCPVLSMIEVTLDEVARRGATRVGVLGFGGPSPLYLEPLGRRGIACETIDASVQASIDAAVRAVMEGRNGQAEADVALGAVSRLRARGTNGIVLGCTEIPLMLGRDREAADLIDPGAVLAEAAVRFALS